MSVWFHPLTWSFGIFDNKYTFEFSEGLRDTDFSYPLDDDSWRNEQPRTKYLFENGSDWLIGYGWVYIGEFD